MANINNKREWHIQLFDTRRKKPVDDDSGQFQVYTANSAKRQAIYNASGVALTQDLGSAGLGYVSRTMTDGELRFYTNVSCSTVDVSILTVSGRSYFLKALKPSNHRVDVDPERTDFTLVVPIDDRASSTILRSTGFSLRKGMIIQDIYLKVVQVGTGLSTGGAIKYNVGIAGDSDAFALALSASVTGYAVATETRSSTGAAIAATYGAKLFTKGRKLFPIPTATVLSFARNAALTHTQTNITAGIMNKSFVFLKYQLAPVEVSVVVS